MMVKRSTHPDTSIRRVLNRREQIIILRLEAHCKRTINNMPIQMHPKIHLHNIRFLKHHRIPRIRTIMRRAIIPAQSRGERHTSLDIIALLQSHMPRQMPNAVLDALRDLREAHPRLDRPLRPFTHLPVHLSALPQVARLVIVYPLQMPLLLACRPVRVLVFVVHLLTYRVIAVGEQICDFDAGWRGLPLRAARGRLLLLLFWLLLFLLGCAGLAACTQCGAIVRLVVVGVVYAIFCVGAAVGCGFCCGAVCAVADLFSLARYSCYVRECTCS